MPQQPAPDGAPPDLRPLDVDGVGAVGLGTAVWAVLTLVMWAQRDALQSDGRGWWLGVGVAGTVLGLMGLPYVVARRRVYRAAASSPAVSSSAESSAAGS